MSHQLAGIETPTADAGVKSVWEGIRRRRGVAPSKVQAARTKVITTLVASLGNRLIDVRDRALILIGFAGALRRSELVALDIEDVTEDADGLSWSPSEDQKLTKRPRARSGSFVRIASRHLPGASVASVDRRLRHRHRPRFPGCRPTRTSPANTS